MILNFVRELRLVTDGVRKIPHQNKDFVNLLNQTQKDHSREIFK